ncbi:hypothetical protein [Streptomyces lavendulae]|uniref:hypothetical protein n=1 Tax=Streptomyces lavendulae TaxID=1914 RepID=UPI003681C0E5
MDGLREFQKNLRQLKDKELNKKVRLVNKSAADIVLPEAIAASPDGKRDAKSSKKYRPGKLDKSIKVVASQKAAVIKAGSASRVPYAAAIHFGYRKRNIRPNRFLFRAMARKGREVGATYEREISQLVRDHLES